MSFDTRAQLYHLTFPGTRRTVRCFFKTADKGEGMSATERIGALGVTSMSPPYSPGPHSGLGRFGRRMA